MKINVGDDKMKKLLLLGLLLLGFVFVATPVMATPYDELVTDVDLADTGWWLKTGVDQNPSLEGQLINSNETTVAAWSEGILGLAFTGTFTGWTTKEAADLTLSGNAINAYNPGFTWDYAVVKYGNFFALYPR